MFFLYAMKKHKTTPVGHHAGLQKIHVILCVMIKNAMVNSKMKANGTIVTVDTWAPMVYTDDGYLAVVWAEKSGATAVIAYKIVLVES